LRLNPLRFFPTIYEGVQIFLRLLIENRDLMKIELEVEHGSNVEKAVGTSTR